MSDRGKIVANVSVTSNGTRKYKSRSSSAPKEYKVASSTVMHCKQTSKPLPLAYSNAALSIEHIPETAIRPSGCNIPAIALESTRRDVPDVFSVVVEDAVRRVVQGNLQDLRQDVGRIQRTLSQMGEKCLFILSHLYYSLLNVIFRINIIKRTTALNHQFPLFF